jgi:hypothetical protein
MFDIEDKEIKNLERDLHKFAKHAFPFATLEALNTAVAEAQKDIRRHLGDRMILRNRWTAGSVQIRKARGLKVDAQAAEVGSAQDYMREQEVGFTRRSEGKHGVPVPMPYSAGQGDARRRTRTVRNPHKLARIEFKRHAGLGVNRKQRNVRSVQEAVKSGKRYIYAQFKQKKGIYRVVGGSKTVKRGWPKGAKLRLVWSLTNRVYSIKAHKWLEPETDKIWKRVPDFYRRALLNQLKRQGVLTDKGKIVR